ncbi:MAG: DUF6399 domain-containing protein [Prolixibacteraceae bacterium]|jgi:hypothetical protein|nr:DUF6399 domain-containing protein [Prolixibacteraceae bacterium]
MDINYTETIQEASKNFRWEREDVASNLVDFDEVKQAKSLRQFTKEQGIPRSTFRHWITRKESIDALPSVTVFLESPEGLALIHKIVTAAHFAFTKDGVASIHNVSTFLKLSGLSPFIASSYSTQRKISNKMDDWIIEFEKNERPKLIQNMPAKKITLAEDETFHPQICMVAIEPVSNFIIIEKYVKHRDGKTWNDVVFQALKYLPVEVIQVTSDEGTGLINHTIKGLNAHHSSDCFHVPHEIGKGTSGALASAVKKAKKEYEIVVTQAEKETSSKEKYDNQLKRPPGRRPNFEKTIDLAEKQKDQARSALEKAIQNQETVTNEKAAIGKDYHPYNTETGDRQDSQKVSELLELRFKNIKDATNDLSDRCKKRVEKAHRVVQNMVATIAFFFNMIELYMDNLQISDRERQLMHKYLIPGFYLQKVAGKEKDTEKKLKISKLSQELLSVLSKKDGAFSEYSKNDIKTLEKAAEECAQIFQRSSSCVEGRNAQLSLRHHGIHRLSNQCLKAQTIVHNYYTRNRDGTTPAERFFNSKHTDLFEWLLEKMDCPARPRKHLKKVA